MILGAHESVAGGLHLAFERCQRDQASALQLWTRSSRQWAAKPLEAAQVDAFRAARRGAAEACTGRARRHAFPVAAHASYSINLASPNPVIYERSVAALLEECRRAEALGIDQVVVHPGAAEDTAAGVRRVGVALRRICDGLKRARVRLLLEITAGQGASVGCTFAQLADMLHGGGARRLGVCLDTQHMWAAGIDWTTARGYDTTLAALEHTVGLRHVEAFHLNDSRRPLGARVDRHERIGDGFIGLEPFRRLVRDARFAALPGYLETPPRADGEESYAEGLARLRSLL